MFGPKSPPVNNMSNNFGNRISKNYKNCKRATYDMAYLRASPQAGMVNFVREGEDMLHHAASKGIFTSRSTC